MKDWKIHRGFPILLLHNCDARFTQGPREWYDACSPRDKVWVCCNCKTEAPEEIGFVAELASCRRYREWAQDAMP